MAEHIQFTYKRNSGEPSKLVGVKNIVEVADTRLVQGDGQFTVTKNGDTLFVGKRLPTLDDLPKALGKLKIGDHLRVEDGDKKNVLSVKAGTDAPTPIDTSGNPKADAYWTALHDQFHPTFLGAYVCKFVVGSSTHSQHAYGNAVDCGAASMARLEEIARWAVANFRELSIQTVIVGARIWTRSDQKWHAYSGEYHTHVHVDFYQNVNTSLPCGVRG